MDCVYVDIVCIQASQALLKRSLNIFRRIVVNSLSAAYANAEFRLYNYIFAAFAQTLRKRSFRLPESVSVSCVKKVYSFIKRLAYGVQQLAFLNISPAVTAHRTTAHTKTRNFYIRIFKRYVLHLFFFLPFRRLPEMLLQERTAPFFQTDSSRS